MTAAFKKGQEVTFIGDYDRKGTVYFFHAIVHSCGKKQMVLTDAKTGKERGRHFAPRVGSTVTEVIGNNTIKMAGGTFPRLEGEQLQEVAMQIAAEVQKAEREHLARCLAAGHGESYDAAIRRQIEELHELRIIER